MKREKKVIRTWCWLGAVTSLFIGSTHAVARISDETAELKKEIRLIDEELKILKDDHKKLKASLALLKSPYKSDRLLEQFPELDGTCELEKNCKLDAKLAAALKVETPKIEETIDAKRGAKSAAKYIYDNKTLFSKVGGSCRDEIETCYDIAKIKEIAKVEAWIKDKDEEIRAKNEEKIEKLVPCVQCRADALYNQGGVVGQLGLGLNLGAQGGLGYDASVLNHYALANQSAMACGMYMVPCAQGAQFGLPQYSLPQMGVQSSLMLPQMGLQGSMMMPQMGLNLFGPQMAASMNPYLYGQMPGANAGLYLGIPGLGQLGLNANLGVNPYAQMNPYMSSPYAYNPYAQNSYNPYAQMNPYSNYSPYAQMSPYMSSPYAYNPYAQNSYNPYSQMSPYMSSPYAYNPYAQNSYNPYAQMNPYSNYSPYSSPWNCFPGTSNNSGYWPNTGTGWNTGMNNNSWPNGFNGGAQANGWANGGYNGGFNNNGWANNGYLQGNRSQVSQQDLAIAAQQYQTAAQRAQMGWM